MAIGLRVIKGVVSNRSAHGLQTDSKNVVSRDDYGGDSRNYFEPIEV